jgi:hypothetical protein
MLTYVGQYARSLPIEWYVLVFPSTLGVVLLALFFPDVVRTALTLDQVWRTLGGNFLTTFFLLVASALIFYGVFLFLQHVVYRVGLMHTDSLHTRLCHFIYGVWPWCAYMLGVFVLALTLSVLYQTAPAPVVAEVSSFYLALDQYVIGEDGYSTMVAVVDQWPVGISAIFAYVNLSAVLGLVLFVVLCTSVVLLREFVLAFFICALLSLPLWWLAPAVSPAQYLVDDVVGIADTYASAAPLREQVFTASPEYQQVYTHLAGVWNMTEQGGTGFAVSTNPSMHVAWGLLCAWYGFRLHRFLGGVLVVFQFWNCVGAVFLLQHFLIDIPTGLLIGVCALFSARLLLRYEMRYLRVDINQWFWTAHCFERAQVQLRLWLRSEIADFRRWYHGDS